MESPDRTPHWRKSSVSYNDDCVECSHEPATVRVRDSKNSAGPLLSLPRDGWTAFLTSVRG
jgi:hypothetical protein